jgi:hypothetical protein
MSDYFPSVLVWSNSGAVVFTDFWDLFEELAHLCGVSRKMTEGKKSLVYFFYTTLDGESETHG